MFGQAAFLPSRHFLPHTAPGASLALAPLAWADRVGAGAAPSVRWRWDDLGSVWGEAGVPHKLLKDLREQAGQRQAVKQNKGKSWPCVICQNPGLVQHGSTCGIFHSQGKSNWISSVWPH